MLKCAYCSVYYFVSYIVFFFTFQCIKLNSFVLHFWLIDFVEDASNALIVFQNRQTIQRTARYCRWPTEQYKDCNHFVRSKYLNRIHFYSCFSMDWLFVQWKWNKQKKDAKLMSFSDLHWSSIFVWQSLYRKIRECFLSQQMMDSISKTDGKQLKMIWLGSVCFRYGLVWFEASKAIHGAGMRMSEHTEWKIHQSME